MGLGLGRRRRARPVTAIQQYLRRGGQLRAEAFGYRRNSRTK
jgi:hypothetical protein